MLNPRITLEQWRAFIAVVDAGGYAPAAEAIHKTQSSVSYAVQKIEQQLGLPLFGKQGRRAVLTAAGELLYRRAKTLLERADALERGAAELHADWEPELRLAVEIVFPTWLLLHSLRMRFVAAAHPDHPLHALGRPLTLDDLREHRHLLVRDTALQRTRESGGWRGAEQRWTVSHKATQIAAACMGLGFAWFPEDAIRRELDSGLLAPLPMREGAERFGELYLIFADADFPSAGARRMAEILRDDVAELCPLADTP